MYVITYAYIHTHTDTVEQPFRLYKLFKYLLPNGTFNQNANESKAPHTHTHTHCVHSGHD